MNVFLQGQRWLSEAEPELGLGTVLRVAEGRVLVGFPASAEQRQYSVQSAPLRRVRYRVGESVVTADGDTFIVVSIDESGGLLVYRGAGSRAVPESGLSAAQGFGSPGDRLLRGDVESAGSYGLRREALELQHRRRRSAVRGFAGGRMDLIPHQLFIAGEVTGRHAPRVLLADEVGLGKTIEACLVIHRLLATGRASRVLVVVPESLVHQWFIELLRRFNLWFHLFDEERCDAVESGHPGLNPFLEDQLVLCGLPLLLDPKRALQAVEAGWDLLVVDEAHHLHWARGEAGPEYRVVEALSRRSEGLLLLTATPEQLGLESHFARLRLLDPARYQDLDSFEREAGSFVEVASVVNRLLGDAPLTDADIARLRGLPGCDAGGLRGRVEALARGDKAARSGVVSELLDRHGPGRVVFRNTRSAMKGFPKRRPRPVPLVAPAEDASLLDGLAREFEADIAVDPGAGGGRMLDFNRDPRIDWLVQWLRNSKGAKVLLICRRREKVLAIEAALRARLAIAPALFHEDLELIQRDRNAAWFADPEGAQILLASEIGSEGRNFQFAQHLILFDLPLDPELVEQRMGRLDRIGQKADIQIHVPFVENSPQEVLFRWFHEGLDAFGRSFHAGRELLARFGAEVRDLAQDFHETHESRRGELDDLVRRTAAARAEVEALLERGRDRLLELNSFRPGPASAIVDAVSALDGDPRLEDFLLRVWDHFGVPVEDLGPRMFRIGADGVFADSFPGLPPEGLSVTFHREAALSREDIAFLTWDHPMVTGALDLLTSGARGGTSCVVWPKAPGNGLWVEAIHVVECIAPAKLHLDRFLPATPLRVVVDVRGCEVPASGIAALDRGTIRDGALHELLDSDDFRELLSSLIQATVRLAEAGSRGVIESASLAIADQVGGELSRLRALAEVNPNVRPEEIAALESELVELRDRVGRARVRLDAVRVVVLGEA